MASSIGQKLRMVQRVVFGLFQCLLQLLFGVVMYYFPGLRNLLQNKMEKMLRGSGVTVENVAETVLSKPHLATMYHKLKMEVFKTADLGTMAPNLHVYSADGSQKHRLLDFMKKGRPLVLNFGSCT